VKVFDRTANLGNNQIINYRCDPTEKWLVLIGIAPGSSEVCVFFLSQRLDLVLSHSLCLILVFVCQLTVTNKLQNLSI